MNSHYFSTALAKMVTVDPQRTAQIREVLAQTLSPDAATRRAVGFVRGVNMFACLIVE
jgi:hypothetical protein